jgi:adenylate cyclase
MSGDPEQEYFADGIAEDIITALSRIHWLFGAPPDLHDRKRGEHYLCREADRAGRGGVGRVAEGDGIEEKKGLRPRLRYS